MDMKLFALHSSKEWGEKIARHLAIQMASHEERDFEDGEHKVRSLENVRGCDVFVVQSLFSDQQQTVNDKICRLLFFIGSLKAASAARVTAVIPYFAYARKDRKTKSRDPVTIQYMAQMLEAVGTDHVLTMDIHNLAAFQNAFRIPTDHLEAMVLFAPYFRHSLKDKDMVVVSPDAGGLKRAEQFRELLSDLMQREIKKAFLSKKRSEGEVSGGQEIVGDVREKIAIIIDDIISSGTTIGLAVEALHQQKAKVIWVCASHGVFVKGANDVIDDPRIEKIMVTNSISSFRLKDSLREKKVEMMDASLLFAQAIKRIHENGSIVDLLEEFPYQ
ncbi:ribose-phosphate diphosphokinase [Legionella israelensis]|uniref:ribose-phosphate diphosphokinase n=1 Tax=Legionella israelensis TaxID=454 RepID=A0A0W0V4F7_9GAMM|nr:ribose-phosphate pyrophosphokinase [Legionella israelensis]KTD14986.1 ribose-phosphate pyrophosphokinase [Legionella israelensis]QBS10020.1 ribose-phosphate pyrophosphokinase [Legionella israelensis]SCX78255.1 ribose-phosphate pyrophosphokinase [Legionella israelensis DSM 19235]STX59598.1 ribose-phosphate pyrophosphokinase [Legionella israelensis]